jgi:hypothetical protein
MELTGKHVTFYEADLCNKDSLRQVPAVQYRMQDSIKIKPEGFAKILSGHRNAKKNLKCENCGLF